MINFRLLAVILIACCGFTASAQQHTYRLKGFMGVQGGESFTYRLELKDSTDNLLSGYAYTYLDEQHDVKAYVVAEADRMQKTLRVREITIVHNHYFQSHATICLVDALLSYSKTEKTLAGPLITMTAGNGASCSKGSISFTDAAEISDLFDPAAPPAGKPATQATATTPQLPKKQPRIIYDTIRPKPAQPVATAREPVKIKQPDNITEGKDKTYAWSSDQIIFEIWDGNNEDNDQVSVLLNGTEVLKNYVLTREKKKLSFPVGGNELNIITIVANNEGGDPPNTANILLSDGDTHYEILAHNTIGKKAMIKIRKK